MKFDVKLVNNDSERYWKCELGKKQAVISALIGFVGDDIKRDFVSATIAAALLTAVSYNWHFQRELNHEMFTTPVFRVKENQAIVPIRLFFESGDCGGDDCFLEGDSVVLRIKQSGARPVHEFEFVFNGEEWCAA